ncbi:MAG: sulfite exporter TauE/SafE family protein [Phycisphaerales bacterium]|nr:sulfite exporter TauE/SafE family protein [Phycisphaerales bacterium]
MNTLTDSNIQNMLPLIIAVLSASVLGSLHCAGMCGGLMFFALGSDEDRTKSARFRLQCAYHGGRLITYTMLGVIAGLIGQAVDFSGGFVGVQRAAAILAGVMMILFGLMTLARVKGIKIKHVGVPAPMRKLVERGQRAAFGLTPFKRAATIGLLTTLLPCGWLYAFAFVAAGTAHPIWGGITMAVFWVGTLPVMVSLGAGIQFLTGPLHARLPIITALAVVVVGVMTAMGRLQAPAMTREALGITETTNAVPTAGDVTCPLCETEEETLLDSTTPDSSVGEGG